MNDIVISEKTQQIVELVTEEKRKPFEAFCNEPGTHLFIIGPFAITSFDPMNIVTQDSMQLHQKGVKVKINGKQYSLMQPVVIYFQEDSKAAQKLHLLLQTALTAPSIR